ncbi:hypothetical protein GGR53DRAFT_485919 [Hypoxylon sp. FL1150]|nr:hypothetical protein GGR53DRAFT_485919 [Hypoxylon sp. FL1150]
MAYLTLALALALALALSVISVASAETATTSAAQDFPDYLDRSAMAVSLVSDSGPVNVEYKVAPLTAEAGLNQTNENTLKAFNVQGNLVLVDNTNYNQLELSNTIAYLTCDDGADSFITPNDVLNQVMSGKPQAILLFSTVTTYCSLGGTDLSYTSIWTMTDPSDASMTKNITSDSSAAVIRATILGDDGDGDSDGSQSQGGNHPAVAMSILYSITGLITLLFLIIIATGAIRAHRHPERYGPRASFFGSPRQSRARGLARAVLETLPIVKFGDPQPAKDPENELESVSGDAQQSAASLAPHEATTSDVASVGSSSKGKEKESPITATELSAASTSASNENTGNNEQTEEEHLGCSICTEDFIVGQDVRVLPCDHKFHPQCIDPWLVNVSGTCPLCRLDLRPQENEESGSSANRPDGTVDPTSSPAPDDEGDAAQRRRLSRLLDWNMLRHASVDERIQALRQYRQSQGATSGNAASGTPTSNDADEEQSRHTKLSDRLREKFHIRTRAHPPADSQS